MTRSMACALYLTQWTLRLAALASFVFVLAEIASLYQKPPVLRVEQFTSLGYSIEAANAVIKVSNMTYTFSAKAGTWVALFSSLGMCVVFGLLARLTNLYRNGMILNHSNVRRLRQCSALLISVFVIQLAHSVFEFLRSDMLPQSVIWNAMSGLEKMDGSNFGFDDRTGFYIKIVMNTVAAIVHFAKFLLPRLDGLSLLVVASVLFLVGSFLEDRIRLGGAFATLKQESDLVI